MHKYIDENTSKEERLDMYRNQIEHLEEVIDSLRKSNRRYEEETLKTYEELVLTKAKLSQADEMNGKFLRENERLQANAISEIQWTDKAKRQAGYDVGVSFDIVWAETLIKSKEVK